MSRGAGGCAIDWQSINIRPRLGNRSIRIPDESLRRKVEEITREILGGAA